MLTNDLPVEDDEAVTASILSHDLNDIIGSGWKRTSLETTAPTDNEKFTLFSGAAFSLEIDSLTRVRWLSLRDWRDVDVRRA